VRHYEQSPNGDREQDSRARHRFRELVESIERTSPYTLLNEILQHDLDGDTVGKRLFQAPGPGSAAYPGGLLRHTVEVAHTARAMAGVAPYDEHIDCDVLVVAAVLHDIGTIDRRPHKRRRSHMRRGAVLVREAAVEARLLERRVVLESDLALVRHAIWVHHASPRSRWQPVSLEALLIHQAEAVITRQRQMLARIETGRMDTYGWVRPDRPGQGAVLHFPSAVDPKDLDDGDIGDANPGRSERTPADDEEAIHDS